MLPTITQKIKILQQRGLQINSPHENRSEILNIMQVNPATYKELQIMAKYTFYQEHKGASMPEKKEMPKKFMILLIHSEKELKFFSYFRDQNIKLEIEGNFLKLIIVIFKSAEACIKLNGY